jgi:hypothetical protein
LLIAGAALSDGRLAFEKSSKADRMSDDSDQMERLAVGLLSFKHLRPDAKARFRSDLRKVVASRGGLSEGGMHFDKAIAADVLSELVERGMRRLVIELSQRARKYMGDDKIEQLEGEMSNSLRELRDFIAGEL